MALIALISSCTESEIQDNELDGFNYPHKEAINIEGGYLASFTESPVVNNGDTFRTKIFLANRSKVYNGDSLEPIIRYRFRDFTTWKDVRENGNLAKVINETAYVKFIVQDKELKKGQTRSERLYSTIIIPRPKGDTLFNLEQEIIIQEK